MFSPADFLSFLGMVALRFGVPLLILVGVGYFLKRMDRRWQEEYRAEEQQDEVRPAKPAERRAPQSVPQQPFIIPPAKAPNQRPQMPLGAGIAAPRTQPAGLALEKCWDLKGCSDAAKADCAAPKDPTMSCWQARFQAEGEIPEECVSCDIFQRHPVM